MIESTVTRRERWFLLACVLGAAACVLLALGSAVPFSGQAAASAPSALIQAARVDLNTAGPDALCTLPGVGEARAKAIVEYRLQNGPFQRVEDAANIPGITPAVVADWQGIAYVS